jgi:acyl-CoA synthetase (AMP-forming)/AMP-acid ligase II
MPWATHVSCYGLTEASGVPFFNELTDSPQQLSETCGRPFPGVEVRIVDPETLIDVPQGERGEIWLRGFCLFEGYYKDPERTAAVLTSEGWLRSGDIGALDSDGRIIYAGRFKDMLKIGGENVAAVEIEGFLSTHPAIELVQIVGVPDERLVEVAAAFVQLKAGATLSPDEVAGYCVGKIASYKIPRYVRFVESWPMSATKIQKFKLAEGFKPDGLVDVRALTESKRGSTMPS